MGKAAPAPILLLRLPVLFPLPPLQISLRAGEEQGCSVSSSLWEVL